MMAAMTTAGFVRITEEGPREGFQSESATIPTSDKVELIEALAETGLTEISCCSFVNAAQVPQMADAEEVVAKLHRRPDVRYTGLWLNIKGFERARACAVDLNPTLVTSASETFGLRNNKRNRAELLDGQRTIAKAYKAAGLTTARGYIFTAFGCNYEGDIPVSQVVSSVHDLVALAEEVGIDLEAMYLCDTIGAASPRSVAAAIDGVRTQWPDLELALHLHDTRGLGLANAHVGLQMGVRRFDSSVAGLGGCPFAGNAAAAGNIATEDLVYLCQEEGFETGIDLDRLIDCALLAEQIVGRTLPGKIKYARAFKRNSSSPSAG
jgi:hydroxymethylglutaryl-CoA lyase